MILSKIRKLKNRNLKNCNIRVVTNVNPTQAPNDLDDRRSARTLASDEQKSFLSLYKMFPMLDKARL